MIPGAGKGAWIESEGRGPTMKMLSRWYAALLGTDSHQSSRRKMREAQIQALESRLLLAGDPAYLLATVPSGSQPVSDEFASPLLIGNTLFMTGGGELYTVDHGTAVDLQTSASALTQYHGRLYFIAKG